MSTKHNFVPTRAAKVITNYEENSFIPSTKKKVVTEHGGGIVGNTKRRVEVEKSRPKFKKNDDNNSEEINMKQARFEIIKFGMTGLNKLEKEEAKTQLAIKLGAKPKKNKYLNYKELRDSKKKESKMQSQFAGNLKAKSSQNSRKMRSKHKTATKH